jgi:predicted  nucleic acid-binding Zn-ribbon protein
MNPDIERLIALQQLDSAALEAQRRLAEEPERRKALEARLEAARRRVADAKQHLTDSQTTRREVEKEVAVHQGRLSKFSDQLMAVKTNVEYQAMQKEIGFAKGEVKALEDKILERMLEADELTATLKRAEGELGAEQKGIDTELRALDADLAQKKEALERISKQRAELIASITPQAFATFDLVSKRRNGIALAEAREGICTICHVRLRPQVFNNLRRHQEIIQCDSCNRILYFVAPAPAAAGGVS